MIEQRSVGANPVGVCTEQTCLITFSFDHQGIYCADPGGHRLNLIEQTDYFLFERNSNAGPVNMHRSETVHSGRQIIGVQGDVDPVLPADSKRLVVHQRA